MLCNHDFEPIENELWETKNVKNGEQAGVVVKLNGTLLFSSLAAIKTTLVDRCTEENILRGKAITFLVGKPLFIDFLDVNLKQV